MLNEEDYSSDTSDEDFVPQGAESDDDSVSENEVDDQLECNEEESPSKGKKRKAKQKTKRKKKDVKINPLLAAIQTSSATEETKEEENFTTNDKKEDSKKVDSLWADFLADVDEKKPEKIEPKPKSKNSWGSLLSNKVKPASESNLSKGSPTTVPTPKPSPSTVKITKVFEFAGEEVRIEEEVDANSKEAKAATALGTNDESESNKNSPNKGPSKRLGLSNIVGLLDNKKQKLSTLEKSKLDWMSFKTSEGIEGELQTHLKSKEGYLEKQAFLERADLRQFEIERNMRMSKRSNR